MPPQRQGDLFIFAVLSPESVSLLLLDGSRGYGVLFPLAVFSLGLAQLQESYLSVDVRHHSKHKLVKDSTDL